MNLSTAIISPERIPRWQAWLVLNSQKVTSILYGGVLIVILASLPFAGYLHSVNPRLSWWLGFPSMFGVVFPLVYSLELARVCPIASRLFMHGWPKDNKGLAITMWLLRGICVNSVLIGYAVYMVQRGSERQAGAEIVGFLGSEWGLPALMLLLGLLAAPGFWNVNQQELRRLAESYIGGAQ